MVEWWKSGLLNSGMVEKWNGGIASGMVECIPEAVVLGLGKPCINHQRLTIH
jgi:hypothetical protein